MKSKALLLLFIFLLNTATGFACTLRMSIHEHEEAAEHHHENDEAKEHHHEHLQVLPHSAHEQASLNGTYITEKDSCCQEAVNSFNTLAKVSPQSGQIVLLAPVTFISAFHQFFLKPVSVIQVNRFAIIDGRRRPPTYSIRIALQSFQI